MVVDPVNYILQHEDEFIKEFIPHVLDDLLIKNVYFPDNVENSIAIELASSSHLRKPVIFVRLNEFNTWRDSRVMIDFLQAGIE